MKKFNDFTGNIEIPGMKKLLRIMKLTTFLILISAVTVLATKTYSQTKTLTLSMDKTTVKDVLLAIEDQSEFYFMYSGKIIDIEREVSINVKDQKVEKVLHSLFAETNVDYTIRDRIIVLTTPEVFDAVFIAEFQQQSVSGKVTDDAGLPLPGVTIVVKGTTQGTATDIDGKYSLLDIPEDATLVFSFVGMRSQEVVVGNQTSINITMEVDAIGLDEIITIGYGTAKKSEVTGAVGVVTAEDLAEQPSVNPLLSLRGKIPGVTIFSNSGEPGGNPRVLIRGMGTINASTQPLYVVDGVQSENIDYLNSTDIESIEVLKDASSAAIYGSRGANGVVIITTQRGLKKEGSVI
ncbi:MAG: TonB-dependent receptor plug domain-containing protein, partial [Draconibacterium sp.]|nr:TonB-dependent receptor plug domain-containing protein [Draconibacterium sp.]